MVRSNLTVCIEGIAAEEVVAETYEKSEMGKVSCMRCFRIHPLAGEKSCFSSGSESHFLSPWSAATCVTNDCV